MKNKVESNVLIFFGFIIVFFALFWRKIFGTSEKEAPATVEELKEELKSNDEVKKYESAKVYKSFSPDTYTKVASELFELMDGVNYNSDNYVIKKMTFYVKNDVDFILLFKAFGYREPVLFSLIADGGDLREWLKADLSASQISQINENYKQKGMLKRI